MALEFWKPGTTGPGSSLDRETDGEGFAVPSALSSQSIQHQRERLPIFKHRMYSCFCPRSQFMSNNVGDELLYAIEMYGVIIVVGQTGCGKTTRKIFFYDGTFS